jgi:hypothetical protein
MKYQRRILVNFYLLSTSYRFHRYTVFPHPDSHYLRLLSHSSGKPCLCSGRFHNLPHRVSVGEHETVIPHLYVIEQLRASGERVLDPASIHLPALEWFSFSSLAPPLIFEGI